MIHWSANQGETGVRVLCATLARPEKRNALTPDMLAELAGCAEHVETADGIGALVLLGDGDIFSAGFDLSLCRDNAEAMPRMLNLLADATLALRSLPVPTLCGVQGGAIAGGCALAAATDFVVSHSDAKFGYPVTRLGVSPAVSGPVLLPAVGEGHARERLLDPGLITGDVAERIGLVWNCVSAPEEVLDAVLSKAHSLAAKPGHGLTATKRWINELDHSTDVEFLASGRAVSNATAQSDEHANLLAHVWKGK